MAGRLLVIAAYDSQLKWAAGLAAEFAAAGWHWSAAVPRDVRHAFSDEQLAAIGVHDLRHLSWADLLLEARRADCVVLALQGPLVERFTDELAILREDDPGSGAEPVVVTGWVGIIIEKIVAGYLDRAGSDVVAVNSADNLREFTSAGLRLGLPPDNLLLSGLPLLPAQPMTPRTGPIRTVVFADQPTIPRDSWDRAYLYQRLLDYARAHPERTVLLKPRHRPEESTFHVMEHHPETLLRMLPPAPANFQVSYEPITELLPVTDLLLTVSSTAGLEAVGAGVRTVFLGDLGVHEKHGNHVLLNSGLIASFEDLMADRIPTPDPDWLADMFVAGDGLRPAQRIVKRVEQLIELPFDRRPGASVARGRYLTGRIAIRKARRSMPPAARQPIPAGPVGALQEGRRRLVLVARALLPAAAFQRLRVLASKRT